MKIKVLGCSGAEYPGRFSPAFLVDGEILFDAGTITSVLGEKQQVFITHPKPHYRKTIEGEIRKMKIDGMRLLRDGETISF